MKTTPTGILWLHQFAAGDWEQVGSKAARLGEIEQAGLPVPFGFCIPAAAYRRHLEQAAPPGFWDGRPDYAQLRAVICAAPLDDAVRGALLAGYRYLLPRAPLGVAVRSSSTAEDLKQHSFAGLYRSILNVRGEPQLLEAVKDCWASYWNDEAVAYRERAGVDHAAHGMAVLVQAMAPAALAGVVYTRCSASDPDVALIEFTRGGGEALVSGETRAASLFLRRSTGRPLDGRKPPRGLNVTGLLALCLRLEEILGEPQDVEWAVGADGKPVILQARPVTAELGPALMFDGRPRDGGQTGEWLLTYDEPFSPLGCEIAMQRYRSWVKAINASFRTRFRPKMVNRDGLLYYHPDWRSPGLPLKLWMNFWRLAALLGSERTRRDYDRRILPAYDRALKTVESAGLEALNGGDLLALLRQTVRLYLDFQYTSYAVGAAATLTAAALDRACRLLFGRRGKWDAMDFLTGGENASIQIELEVYRLGQLLRPYLPPAGEAGFRYADLLALKDQAGPFWPALTGFLKTSGYLWADRYPRDPAWEINQEALASSLWIAAQTPPEQSLETRHQEQKRRRGEAAARALETLSRPGGLPLKKQVFTFLLRRAETLFPYKENRNHATYRGMMAVRAVARELGRRMAARHLLQEVGDLFFLEMDEIETLWNNPRAASGLLRKVRQRKERYYRARQAIQQRAGGEVRRDAAVPAEGSGAAFEVRGDPCSPGLAKGPARLVSGPGEAQRVQPGEIVVCTQLRPAWSSIFSRAGGIVIEMGSLLSHGSALAREYGVPAVVNVAEITSLVRENDWLVVDGNLGRVAIERGPDHKAEEPAG